MILRVICSECGRTHALLLSSMVPYSQIPAEDQRRIAEAYEQAADRNGLCKAGSGIDENNIKSVIRRYVYFWRERLLAHSISLNDLNLLAEACFSHYSRQFMQIRGAPNSIVPSPT